MFFRTFIAVIVGFLYLCRERTVRWVTDGVCVSNNVVNCSATPRLRYARKWYSSSIPRAYTDVGCNDSQWFSSQGTSW
jgi:hypothetical protein